LGTKKEPFANGTITYHWSISNPQRTEIALVPPSFAAAIDGQQPVVSLASDAFAAIVREWAVPMMVYKRAFRSAFFPATWGPECSGSHRCCEYIVEVPLIAKRYHHRYDLTHTELRRAYHRGDGQPRLPAQRRKASRPPQMWPSTVDHVFRPARPITVALHHRVGDVKLRVSQWQGSLLSLFNSS